MDITCLNFDLISVRIKIGEVVSEIIVRMKAIILVLK